MKTILFAALAASMEDADLWLLPAIVVVLLVVFYLVQQKSTGSLQKLVVPSCPFCSFRFSQPVKPLGQKIQCPECHGEFELRTQAQQIGILIVAAISILAALALVIRGCAWLKLADSLAAF